MFQYQQLWVPEVTKIEWNSIFWCKKGNLILQPFTIFHRIFMKHALAYIYWILKIKHFWCQILLRENSRDKNKYIVLIYLEWRWVYIKEEMKVAGGSDLCKHCHLYQLFCLNWFANLQLMPSGVAVKAFAFKAKILKT